MTDREKVVFNEEFKQHLENSLNKNIAKLKNIFERGKTSAQYQLNEEFRAQCDSIEGLLADMSKDMKMIKLANR